jgi:hypothetical protein
MFVPAFNPVPLTVIIVPGGPDWGEAVNWASAAAAWGSVARRPSAAPSVTQSAAPTNVRHPE